MCWCTSHESRAPNSFCHPPFPCWDSEDSASLFCSQRPLPWPFEDYTCAFSFCHPAPTLLPLFSVLSGSSAIFSFDLLLDIQSCQCFSWLFKIFFLPLRPIFACSYIYCAILHPPGIFFLINVLSQRCTIVKPAHHR